MIPPPIEESFEKLENYPSVTDRYYTKYYVTPETVQSNETHCILVHSNRICVVTLAESHPVVKENKTIVKIDFKVTEKLDRSLNKVSGKGKKGAQCMQKNSILCFIECNDDSRYSVYCCLKGKLVEVNLNLLTNPQLLVNKTLTDGYIAIVLPNLKDIEEQKKDFSLAEGSSLKANDESLDID